MTHAGKSESLSRELGFHWSLLDIKYKCHEGRGSEREEQKPVTFRIVLVRVRKKFVPLIPK
jgi:hypothetical protein